MNIYSYGIGSSMVTAVEIGIGFIAAIVLTILICIFILPEKKRDELSSPLQWLHDQVNFRTLWIEKILKVFYILGTMIFVCIGFFLLFGRTFLLGLILILIGIFALRIIYEYLLLMILILKNTRQINEKLGSRKYRKTLKGLDPEAPEQKYEKEYNTADLNEDKQIEEELKEAAEDYTPEYRFCAQCGTRYDIKQGGCPNGCK